MLLNLRTLKALIIALPEILRLIRTIQEKYSDAQMDAQIKKDLGSITDAFKNKDAAALDSIFKS